MDNITQLEDILQDKNTYKVLSKFSILTLQNKLNDLVKCWETYKYIEPKTAYFMKCYNGNLTKFYSLPKIYKEKLGWRPIVSMVGFPTYHLATMLSDILINLIGKTNTYVKDSWNFHSFIKNIEVPQEFVLVSFNIVSVFSNIPVDLHREHPTKKN